MNPTRPVTVAAVRGALYFILTALVGVIIALTPLELEAFGPAAPFVVMAARVGEALLLDRRQPPQAGLLGGEPAAPVFDWAEEMAGDGDGAAP